MIADSLDNLYVYTEVQKIDGCFYHSVAVILIVYQFILK